AAASGGGGGGGRGGGGGGGAGGCRSAMPMSAIARSARGPRVALVLLSVHRGEDGHVHDLVHLSPTLQDVDRASHADQDRADRLSAAEAVEQLVGDVGGVQVGKDQHVRGRPQTRERVAPGEDALDDG